MSVSAYVLIQTEMGRAPEVAGAIRAVDGVEFADVMTGPYDILAKATSDTMDELGRMVVSQIEMTSGITRTLTCPVVNL